MCNCAAYNSDELYTWCTNCGNYGIHASIKRALADKNIKPSEVLLCFDIGCHGNGADKINAYSVHGLHGRILPFAAGAAIANKAVTTIAFGGDGGTLSEGINHLIHSIRANYNFTFVLHDNSNYGLTTGQASATTKQGLEMNSSPSGVTSDTLIPMELVLSLKPSFAARTFSGNIKHMESIFKQAIEHEGFSYVEVLQSCPTYNKVTPHEWYAQRVYDVSTLEDYDSSDLELARKVAQDVQDKIAIGVLYLNKDKKDYYSRLASRKSIKTELVEEVKGYNVGNIIDKFR
ncbi:2-oxoglutarate/2-oxoacid ferredoxin oxidoreductase subunit beta [Patescibacteria group bacterium]|nr:2-oxoacid:ferredoxin oxidoreductase subunit beta [Candidatus Dojkabacteria bacterium]CAG1022202.1 2-oxoglutarate/2-oxoacid ferredoxin oxidoreductase subunit beta [Patescibacteria group bacterium]